MDDIKKRSNQLAVGERILLNGEIAQVQKIEGVRVQVIFESDQEPDFFDLDQALRGKEALLRKKIHCYLNEED